MSRGVRVQARRGLHNGSQPGNRNRPAPTATNELHGPSYQMLMSEQDQSGEPRPHGVPPEYEHPMSLMDLITKGGPRALPVTQEIEHGPAHSRSAEFDAAAQEAAALGARDAALGWFDRRYEGRRHRGGPMYTAQEPLPRGGWQRDVNTIDRLTNF